MLCENQYTDSRKLSMRKKNREKGKNRKLNGGVVTKKGKKSCVRMCKKDQEIDECDPGISGLSYSKLGGGRRPDVV